MRAIISGLVIVLLAIGICSANSPEFSLDSNTAFYEGEHFTYVMSPPEGFRLVTYQAKLDGYSFAFVPEEETYDSAQALVGVHIYKIRGMSFSEAIRADTSAIREHFGQMASIRLVEPIASAVGDSLLTFYLDCATIFIPNVMIAYFDGTTELIVYELLIRPNARKIPAEEQFVRAIGKFKALKRAELGLK